MAISTFQFSNPTLMDVKFTINEGFSKDKAPQELNITTTVEVKRFDGTPTAQVTLTLSVGEETEIYPYYISVTERARFRWEETDPPIPERQLDCLLNQNAPALLLSYIRPLIFNITGNSQFRGLNIPYIDFTKRNDQQQPSEQTDLKEAD